MRTRPMVFTAVVCIALVAMAGGAVFAQGPRTERAERWQRGSLEPEQRRLERMTMRLDLTEEQQTAIGDLLAGARQKNLELRKEIERARHELRGEMLKDEPDEKAVVRLTERVGKLRSDLQVNRAKTRLAVRSQLSPEQRDKMITTGRSGARPLHRGAAGWRGRRGPAEDCPMDGGPRPGHPRTGRRFAR